MQQFSELSSSELPPRVSLCSWHSATQEKHFCAATTRTTEQFLSDAILASLPHSDIFFPSLHSTQPSHPPLFHSYFLSPGLCHEGLSASALTAQSRQPQPLPMAGFWAQSHLTGRFVCCCEPISQCITHRFVQKVNVGQSSLIATPRSANGKVGCLSAPASLRGLLKWRLCL